MFLVALANQKGGVGKTTTVHNLGPEFVKQGYRTLLIDMDSQGNLTDSCGIEPDELDCTVMHLMDGRCRLRDVLQPLDEGYDLIPSNVDLAEADIVFAQKIAREYLLKKALNELEKGSYDIVLIDCPPNLGLCTINAMTAATHLVLPVRAEYHPLKALRLVHHTYTLVKDNLNPDLHILGVALTFFDRRKTLNRQVRRTLQDSFGDIILETTIRNNIALAEAPSYGKPIYDYQNRSHGAEDYRRLSREILARLKEA